MKICNAKSYIPTLLLKSFHLSSDFAQTSRIGHLNNRNDIIILRHKSTPSLKISTRIQQGLARAIMMLNFSCDIEKKWIIPNSLDSLIKRRLNILRPWPFPKSY
ncbi:hypothetical protein DP42_3891 [Burkholderia pseudomallei]|nr:hypothetical protein DP42_3891 [Burkholderia pseudomallei]